MIKYCKWQLITGVQRFVSGCIGHGSEVEIAESR